MNIPALDLEIIHQPLKAEIMAAIEEVFDTNCFILGPGVLNLEERIAAYSGAGYGIGVSSGTDALLISLMALDVGPGDEVITTDFSFFATAGVIARLGAKPVFVDINPITYNIEPAKIDAAITARTKAIIPVHLYGQCADMEPIVNIAKKHGIKIVEDAAQAIGANYRDGRRAGGIGDLGCLSFFPSKNLGGFGDGGMVVSNNEELNEKVRILRVHGSKPKYYHKIIGGNFRLDALQAAVLNVKLNYLDKWTAERQKNAAIYEVLFKKSGLPEKEGLSLPQAVYRDSDISHYHIYNQYVIRAPHRDNLQAYLKQAGISTAVYYPVPFHRQECFNYLRCKASDFPEAEAAAKETLALPIYPGLTEEQQEYIVNSIKEFY